MKVYKQKYFNFAEYVYNLKYGYIDREGIKHLGVFTNPTDDYYLQTPSETIKNGCGICFDTVELMREYLTNKGLTSE